MKTRSAPAQWHVTETTCPPAFCSRPHRGHRHSRRTSRSTRLPGPFMVLTVDSRSSLAAPGNPPGFPSASGGLVTVAPRATCFHQAPPFRSPRFRQPGTPRLVPHQDTMVHPRQLPVDFPFVAELAGVGPGGGGRCVRPIGMREIHSADGSRVPRPDLADRTRATSIRSRRLTA
jgi:hypothetical protein